MIFLTPPCAFDNNNPQDVAPVLSVCYCVSGSDNISKRMLPVVLTTPIMRRSVAGEETESFVGGSKQPAHCCLNALMSPSLIEVIG